MLREHPVDPSLVEGARNAVGTCLGVEAGQHVVLIVETGYDALGAAFLRAADGVGAKSDVHIVDARKATREPFLRNLSARLIPADASLFVGGIEALPAAFRHQLIDAGGATRRHGHMPGLTTAMMQQSMRTDYREVQALSERLVARLDSDVTIHVRSPRGTDLLHPLLARPALARGGRDPPRSGLDEPPGRRAGHAPGRRGRHPGPGRWHVGRGGSSVTNADRLRFVFEDGAVRTIEGGAGTTPDALLAQLDTQANGRRLGQIGLGTNVGVVAAVGNLLQDLKMPGFHAVLGHTSPEHTGASWSSEVEVPLLVRRADVDVEGTPILRNGRYVAPWV